MSAKSETQTNRWRRIRRWLRRRWLLCSLLTLIFGFGCLNALAYSHARAMLRFVPGGVKTRSPKEMTWTEKAITLVTGVTIPKPINHQTPKFIELPYTTHYFSSRDGIQLEAWHASATPSLGLVVLVHGYSGCKSVMLQEGKFFHDSGYDVLWLDCRASGGSQGEWTTVGYLEALDVEAAINYAHKTWTPTKLLVFGQSMGAAAALRTISCTDCVVDGLILETPFDSLLHTVSHRFEAMGVPDLGLARLLLFWGGVQTGIPGFDHNPADYAASVRCPTLVMWGDKDRYVLRKEVDKLYKVLPGPKSFCILNGVDHVSGLSAAPVTWKQAIREFLSSYSK